MQTKQDQIVTQSVTDPRSLPPNSIGYGVIMRYGMDVWKYPHWSAHQYVMQSNALAIVLMEKKNPVLIRRSQTGCSAVYDSLSDAVDVGMTLSALLHDKQIPAALVLYQGVGYLTSDVWLCTQEHTSERIALMGSAHKLYVTAHMIETLTLPIGVGMLPCSKKMQQSLGQLFYVLQDYRDPNEQENNDKDDDKQN